MQSSWFRVSGRGNVCIGGSVGKLALAMLSLL